MRSIVVLLAIAVAASAAPQPQPRNQKIVGGSLTTIDRYPFHAALLETWDFNFYSQACGGTILNTRSILTASHCYRWLAGNRYRVRVGSSYANSGGVVHAVSQNIPHPNYNERTVDNDVAITRLQTAIVFNPLVQPGSIVGPNYNVADNQQVWAVGFGTLWYGGPPSEQLSHVQIWTVNLAVCKQRYAEINLLVTDNMLCSGWLDVGGRDACQGDSGGPLLHNNNVVGVCSWGSQCAMARYPGVNARVSTYSNWIQANA